MGVKTATDQTFKRDVLDSPKPVLVEFWAVWCRPCKKVAPYLDEIARDYEAQIDVVKVDIDESPRTAQDHGVLHVPTLNVYVGGQCVKQIPTLAKSGILRALEEFV